MPELRISRAGLARRAAGLRRRLRTGLAGVRSQLPTAGVALTFDDGPHPGSTDLVLDILGELGVPATFFCVGKNVRRHPDLVARMLAEGHAVGSHSESHPHPGETPIAALVREYRLGRDAVAAAGGSATLFRPPHGHIGRAAIPAIRALGLRPWLWSVDPEDWRPGAATDRIASVVAGAGAGDVVLLHDWIEQPWAPAALDRSATVAAIRTIVSDARARGLAFARVDAQPGGSTP